MRKLELKVPPVVVFMLVILLMYGLKVLTPSMNIRVPFVEFVVGALTLLSGYMGIAGVYEFRKVKTTVNPVKPDAASSVVRTGVFASHVTQCTWRCYCSSLQWVYGGNI